MKPIEALPTPQPVDVTGIVSWAHIGDLHITTSEQQNYTDLHDILTQLNDSFTKGLNFAFLPGDMAEHGAPEEFQLARSALDRLHLPWFSIVGDHDVHTRSFEPFHNAMSPALCYVFDCGDYRFVALNAFAKPAPDSFLLGEDQLSFLKQQFENVATSAKSSVIFLHCYPSDLKQDYERVRKLIGRYCPLLVEMGHTHYNEVARDEPTLYATTRSTGQIEEGPAGFSITNLDHGCVSWKFRELQSSAPFVMITSPADWRLIPRSSVHQLLSASTRAKVWSQSPIRMVFADTDRQSSTPLERIPETNVWLSPVIMCLDSVEAIRVTATAADGTTGYDEIQLPHPSRRSPPLQPRDQDNVVGAWPERGILGTQLGPNKNGRKW